MRTLVLLFLGVAVGWAASGVDWSREALAQQESPPPVSEPPLSDLQQRIGEWRKGAADYSQINRYQISAADDGCYRVDTATGRMWHVTFGAKPRMIAGEVETADSQE